MKTKIECRADQLATLAFCPICGSSVVSQYWCQETFPGEISTKGYQANIDDKLSIQFECAAEFSINQDEEIISRLVCSNAMADAVAALEEEADCDFQDQDEDKCRVCGCTESRACVTEGVPCHWAEPDLCSACAVKAATGDAA
jgi:hypothetical protein